MNANVMADQTWRGRPPAVLVRAATAVLLVTGMALAGKGSWIYGKAKLAQFLLSWSWRSTLAGDGPVRPWPWADTHAVARLQFEERDINIIVLSGANGRTLAFGPGHLDGSALPGERGNCVVMAHRDTHFEVLRYLMPGDVITVQRPDRRKIRYTVKMTRVIDKHDASILQPDGRTRLTLITCYPFEAIVPGGPLRYVVVADAP